MWLLLSHPLVIALMVASVPFWVKLDTEAFKKDGSKNSLHELFHRQRLTWRAGIAAALIIGGSLPSGSWASFGCSALGLLVFYAGYWARTFNPQLSVARKLAYVERFYVSPSPTAARFPDRFIWSRASKECAVGASREEIQQVAGPMLQKMLNWTLGISMLVYGLCLAGALWLANG